MRTRKFWLDAAERATRAAANAAAGFMATSTTPLLSFDWSTLGAVSAFAAGMSLCTSIGGSRAGDADTAGLVSLHK